MIDQSRLMFIHGKEGSSRGFKATLLRQLFPDMVIPNFSGDFRERMARLAVVAGDHDGWTLIGSSMGGLMAAAFACQHPQQVRQLVLLAPALPWLPEDACRTVDVPVVAYHGRRDDVVSLAETRRVAGRIFRNLTFHEVDDDHGLGETVQSIDWVALLEAA